MKEKSTQTISEIPQDWIEKLMRESIKNRASDIHIEPERDKSVIRFRIDGLLYETERFEKTFHDTIVSKIKVHAGMDITIHRLPQDGHFEFQDNDQLYNVRASAYPTIHGEAVVLRILNRKESLRTLEELGFGAVQIEQVLHLINKPYGMILITGPSGSGKTTLLNSILSTLNKSSNNVVAIEDPVELQMEGMRQTQVNQYEEFNFATALKAVLRQDPDIIMVGEIRDDETAQISIQAALTGRLVFSTFHTLDVFSIISRMIEMGIPRTVLAHTLSGVISARLVRKICNTCKAPYQTSREDEQVLGGDLSLTQLYKGAGCDECLKSGYYGRIGVFEVVSFDNEIRAMIIDNIPYQDILKVLKEKRMQTLGENALEKVRQGITTLEEVFRVVGRPD